MTKLTIPFRNYANAPQNFAAGHITGSAGRGLDTPDVENQREYLRNDCYWCKEPMTRLGSLSASCQNDGLSLLRWQ
jgi:hypothetical protein